MKYVGGASTALAVNTNTNFLIILGVLTCSAVALVWKQTSRLPLTVGFQNDLGFDVEKEPTISPTTITDFKPFRPTSVFTIPADLATPNLEAPIPAGKPLPAVAIGRRSLGRDSRRYIPFEGYSYDPSKVVPGPTITASEWDPFKHLTSLPPITEQKTYSDIFTDLFPTTTHTITITITPREVGSLESWTTTIPGSRSWEAPRTFQTITGAPSLTSSVVARGDDVERRGYGKDLASCQALASAEILECFFTKSILIPVSTYTVVQSGSTQIVVEVTEGPRNKLDAVPVSTAV
ncbi:hypothetical protein DID88_005656 [Monilinia fructigena]|uniref:Uncharacterized protein n=1 Tax=Monilinia fructigena TaxID=38457 RepID=A0A395J0F0_9HELO|nr:hypothetical protein DID88_005656 [Monilinia fructigena]